MKSIAIINLGYIGDVINSSPISIELKKNYPSAKLIYITIPASFETAKCIPGVDEVLIYDKKGKDKGLSGLIKKALIIRQSQKIDMAIILNESLRTAFFAYLSGAKKRVGRNSDLRGFLLTHKIPHLEEEIKMQIHISEHYMRALKPLGLYNTDYDFGFNFSKEDKSYINEILEESGYSKYELIGFCPCARHEDKNWDSKEAAKFINYINQNPNRKVVIVGDKRTSEFVMELNKLGVDEFLDLTCKTSIPQLAALISRFKKFISADTGPMHLAYVFKIPTVAFFYHNVTKKWGPKDLETNRTIFSPDRKLIRAEQIIELFNELPEKN